MNLNAFNILLVIALVLTILAMVRPQWPFLAVAVLLVIVALLAGPFLK